MDQRYDKAGPYETFGSPGRGGHSTNGSILGAIFRHVSSFAWVPAAVHVGVCAAQFMVYRFYSRPEIHAPRAVRGCTLFLVAWHGLMATGSALSEMVPVFQDARFTLYVCAVLVDMASVALGLGLTYTTGRHYLSVVVAGSFAL